jgi:hypothetical protein
VKPGLGRRAGAASVLALAVLLGLPASPASADPVISGLKPEESAVLDSASVTISGTATADAPLDVGLVTVRRVTLTLAGKTLLTKDCGAKSCSFSQTTSLPLNGPYSVTVEATETTLGLEGKPTTITRKFAVAAPAARPVLDPPRVTDGRTVELSWTRNTEGDMLYYAVFRKDPGATKYFQVGAKVDQPTSGAKVSFTDTTTPSFGGGDYSYQVVAVRRGATGTAGSEKLSEPSVGAAATVPPLPPTSTTVVVPGQPAGGPTTTVKPGPPGGVDLSGFIASRPPAVTLPSITVPEPPDTGFAGTLPFGARPSGDDVEDGDAEAIRPRDPDGTSIVSLDAGRPLVPVAGGLVLLLLALHIRLLGRRVKAPVGTDLPVVAASKRPPAPAPAVAVAAPAAVAPPDPDPHHELFDFNFEPDADLEPDADFVEEIVVEDDWASPEPVTLWAPADDFDEPEAPKASADEIEVVDIVSSPRRPLARAGSR